MCHFTCVKFFFVRLSNKVVNLDLASNSEKVENHWLKCSLIRIAAYCIVFSRIL